MPEDLSWMTDPWALVIAWEKPTLPPVVGPFESAAEAEKWAELNILNGTWRLEHLAFPYMRAGDTQ